MTYHARVWFLMGVDSLHLAEKRLFPFIYATREEAMEAAHQLALDPQCPKGFSICVVKAVETTPYIIRNS